MKRILTIILVALLATACRTVERVVEVPRVTEVHDTLRLTQRDTHMVYVFDSVRVSGDTVYRERVLYRDRHAVDTVYRVVERTDTITVIRNVETPAKKSSAPWWMLIVGIVLGAAGLARLKKILL